MNLNDSIVDIEMKSSQQEKDDPYGNDILQCGNDDKRDTNGDAPSWNKSYQGHSQMHSQYSNTSHLS